MSWVIENDVIFRNFHENEEKVAIFDLDFTLIRPKTWGGKVFFFSSYLTFFANFALIIFEFSYAS